MSQFSAIDIHIGKRLRFGRAMLGMSQETIGECIGVTFQQVQKYERGANCLRASKLLELSRAMKVPVTFFFDGLEDGRQPDVKYNIPGASDSAGEVHYDVDVFPSRDSIELMRAFNRISDGQLRGRIVDLVRAMADNKGLL